MRSTTLLGMLAGTLVLGGLALQHRGDLDGFANPVALLITFGGTLAAAIVSFSWQAAGPTLDAVAAMLWRGRQSATELSDVLVNVARKGRERSLAGLDVEATGARDPYARLALQLVADGTAAERVQEVLQLESESSRRRRAVAERVFRTMGSYAPMFGLIGTIIGLIRMLRNLSDPSQIGAGMAVALVTTLYGVLVAALIFLPCASKVRELAAEEATQQEMVRCGIRAIQEGENPQLLREKLDTYARGGATG